MKNNYIKMHEKVATLRERMSYSEISKKLKMSKSMIEYYLNPERKRRIRKNSIRVARINAKEKKKLKIEIESLIHDVLELRRQFGATFFE